ncbi:Ni/Fe hydrogenase subunit alpha [Desulforamulus aeronauticus]|uniref:F420-non-reducing hydrogenase large subunit n=1 Tax=Desulforamulus aeronauticus DSM 10349 TaxID=1121421 RepID=A0A1M6TAH8_9FIRM|nr:Ni/Fe hydrogenase subunit alpha [Desulforamulus aeronauticus]SHK53846.1 F420-non-reducing hydrogenase large subunit [Desulforamulus aeronauticus DSM 10349]
MGKTITIQPVSRVEGHARVTVQLDDGGRVSDTKVQVVEIRGFEKFCLGRPVEEMPRIVTRICGVCPWAHHLAAAKAADAVFGVQIPETAKKIRELAYSAHFIHSHLLHFFFLAGADFLCDPGTDYLVRNIMGLADKHPILVQKIARIRNVAQKMTEIIAGKAIHPDVAVPGGFSKSISEEQRKELRSMAGDCLEFVQFSLDFAKDKVFMNLLPQIKNSPTLNTGFLGMVSKDGELNFYEGRLRLLKLNGECEEFEPSDYLDYISEHTEDWTYMKFPYDKSAGKLSMDPDQPIGVYRTNSLARLNVCDSIPTPLAQKELIDFRKEVGGVAQHNFLYHWARLIEALYAAERAVELLEDEGITDTHVRESVKPCAGRGVGVVEAPRGTLIHDYQTDDNGLLTRVNLIVGTTHNNAAINISAFRTAREVIKDGVCDEDGLNKIEMAIRAYDPCYSCATHKIDGRVAVRVAVVDSKGQVVQTLGN